MKSLPRPKTARNWRQSPKHEAPAGGRGLGCASTNARGKCAARVFVRDEGEDDGHAVAALRVPSNRHSLRRGTPRHAPLGWLRRHIA